MVYAPSRDSIVLLVVGNDGITWRRVSGSNGLVMLVHRSATRVHSLSYN